jgi:peptidoglycan/LPS O-acetylase OafA/YrhL
MTAAPEHSRLPALDGLRGLAALAVVFLHLTMQVVPHTLPAIAVKDAFALGWTGVDLFFVLSGFLITGLLVDAKGSTNYFRVFYARRALRILPLYYAALIFLFTVPFLVTLPHDFRVSFRDQLWFWFYLQNYHWKIMFAGWTGHLWSLAIEEQFYLVWPLVILLASRKKSIAVCIALIAVSVIYRAYAVYFNPHLDIYYPTQARLDGLAVGSAIALLVAEPIWLSRLRRHAPSVMIAAAILFIVSRTQFPVTGHGLSPLGNLSVAVFYGCLLVFALCATTSALARALRSRFLRFYGRYSYALYVIHVPAMSVLGHVGVYPDRLSFGGSDLVGELLYIAIVTPVITLLAWLSWHLFEKHFLKLKRHFVYDRVTGNAKAPLSAAPLVVE